MKTLSTFLLCLMFLTVGCSSVYDVSHDYDSQADFENLETYAWLPLPVNAEISSLTVKRIKRAVNTQLEAKGLEMRSESPDFLIATHIGKDQRINVTDWGYAYSPYGRYRSYSGIEVWQWEEGTFILDFVDAESKDLLWRGSAKAELRPAMTPEEAEKLINEAVEKILRNFPPVSSK